MKYLIFTFFLGVLTSCNFKDTKALEQVEEMETRFTELKNGFNSVDNNALREAKKQYDESLSYIKKYYSKDTVEMDFMNNLEYYKRVKYYTKSMTKNKLVISDNIAIVEKQISNLKTDIENSSIQGEQLTNALINEKRNLKTLDSTVVEYLDNAALILEAHDSIADYVKSKTMLF